MSSDAMPGKVFLKPQRDAPVRLGNPWIFAGAIERVEPHDSAPGSTVAVHDARGNLLGCGYYNPVTATIRVRMLWWGGCPPLTEIIGKRLDGAFALRSRIIPPLTDCYRVLNGDGDGLSGVVIDRYGDIFVIQLFTAGAERMREQLVAKLRNLARPRSIIERSLGAVRREEGLEDRVGVLAGEAVSQTVALEHGAKIQIDFAHGQKTGYFLDQRENRRKFASLAGGARVLDACCYSGGFGLAAMRGQAKHVVAVDTSARALEWARANLALNGYTAGDVELVRGDAAPYLKAAPGAFDAIVLDPPPLARSRKYVARAARMYVELNALAIGSLAPGGYFMTFSCSPHFCGEDFIRAVSIAQSKSARKLRLLEQLGPGPDHPILLGHPEGRYLTGLLLADLT